MVVGLLLCTSFVSIPISVDVGRVWGIATPSQTSYFLARFLAVATVSVSFCCGRSGNTHVPLQKGDYRGFDPL